MAGNSLMSRAFHIKRSAWLELLFLCAPLLDMLRIGPLALRRRGGNQTLRETRITSLEFGAAIPSIRRTYSEYRAIADSGS